MITRCPRADGPAAHCNFLFRHCANLKTIVFLIIIFKDYATRIYSIRILTRYFHKNNNFPLVLPRSSFNYKYKSSFFFNDNYNEYKFKIFLFAIHRSWTMSSSYVVFSSPPPNHRLQLYSTAGTRISVLDVFSLSHTCTENFV